MLSSNPTDLLQLPRGAQKQSANITTLHHHHHRGRARSACVQTNEDNERTAEWALADWLLRQQAGITVGQSLSGSAGTWQDAKQEIGFPSLCCVVFGLSLSISCRGIIPHLRCHPSTCSIYHALISLSAALLSLVWSRGT